ncbi:hypothetical protein O4220_00315 [Rhodococcus ruber]|uniref:Uncharacterized protein n=1 Tax=Rhodococcus ruber TaxID=1830 RepID=A0ABT4M7L1_9NOCA|nr:hypothetical protein [Rhodococcus ruber]MCZ4516939.1 hypothetical protein [Rhodococcus ruber]
MTTTEKSTTAARSQVARAAARASVALYERDGREVPQWIRDAAEGCPTSRTALTPATAADRQGPHPDTPGAGLLRCPRRAQRLA